MKHCNLDTAVVSAAWGVGADVDIDAAVALIRVAESLLVNDSNLQNSGPRIEAAGGMVGCLNSLRPTKTHRRAHGTVKGPVRNTGGRVALLNVAHPQMNSWARPPETFGRAGDPKHGRTVLKLSTPSSKVMGAATVVEPRFVTRFIFAHAKLPSFKVSNFRT